MTFFKIGHLFRFKVTISANDLTTKLDIFFSVFDNSMLITNIHIFYIRTEGLSETNTFPLLTLAYTSSKNTALLVKFTIFTVG